MKKLVLFLFLTSLFAGLPSYYYKLPLKKQRQEFKKILTPMIERENQKFLNEREQVLKIFNKNLFMLDKESLLTLTKIAKKYKIKDIYNKKEFLKKINTIPEKLVLAQAAVESSWGKSYFAIVANNLFGQWDYSGKGMIPRNRDENATHTIRVFRSPEDSLAVYMRNLNRNPAYKKFRELRYKYWEQNKTFPAEVGASTLLKYSQLREEYVEILKNVIKQF